MKITAFHLPLTILCADLFLSLPQINLKLIGALRLVFIPILIIVLFDLYKRSSIKCANFALRMGIPWLLLLFLFVFQIVSIPSEAVSIHLSGCVKFIEWTLLYLCLLLSMNDRTTSIIRSFVFGILLLIFTATIVQYPVLITRSSMDLATLISAYGQQEEKDVFGLFAAANEDANCLVTLFPFVLYYIEQCSPVKRLALRVGVVACVAIALFFNGTRTALFITFPLVTFLFYFKLTTRSLILITPVILTALTSINVFFTQLVGFAFSREAKGEGTFAFRVTRLWLPASRYTYENSPLWGFGSRGWEFVGNTLQMVRDAGETNAFEVIPPHNVYVWAYVSWGTLGLLCYILFLVTLLVHSFQLSTFVHPGVADFGRTLFASSVAYCIWAGISNAQIEAAWVIFLSLSILVSSLKASVWTLKRQSVLAIASVDA